MTALGRGGVEVGPLSFGATGIGNLHRHVGDEEAHEAVAAAGERGIRCFDTARHYGLGLSERRPGAALREYDRAHCTVSTKVGRRLEPADGTSDDLANGFAVLTTHRRLRDCSADGIRRGLEVSMDCLGLDHLDVVRLHDPDDRADLFPAAIERGTSVIGGGVFNSGLLANPTLTSTHDYARTPLETPDRALRQQAPAGRHDVTLRAAALAFCSAHPSVGSGRVGVGSAAEVRDCAEQFAIHVPAAFWRELRETDLLPTEESS
ncbi:aldo/keto reductase [Streptomyces sp. NPDC002545]